MKDTLSVLAIGILFAAMGYWVGYNEGLKRPSYDLVISQINREIIDIQKDIIRWQETSHILLVRMAFMEKWRHSILYRPPEFEVRNDKHYGSQDKE